MRSLGTRPVLMWVEVLSLHVDHSYQREVSTKNGEKVIASIANHFSWPLFQPITISKRQEGGYWIIDGQHRFRAAERIGISEIPAVLVELPSNEEKANAFVQINSARVKVNALALYHARLVSGDPSALRLKACCDKVGVEIPRYPKMLSIMKPNESLAPSKMIMLMEKYGDDALIWSLRMLREANPDMQGGLAVRFVKLLTIFYDVYQDFYIDEKSLKELLCDFDYSDLVEQAKRFTGKRHQQITTDDALETFRILYNDMCEGRDPLPAQSDFLTAEVIE